MDHFVYPFPLKNNPFGIFKLNEEEEANGKVSEEEYDETKVDTNTVDEPSVQNTNHGGAKKKKKKKKKKPKQEVENGEVENKEMVRLL